MTGLLGRRLRNRRPCDPARCADLYAVL